MPYILRQNVQPSLYRQQSAPQVQVAHSLLGVPSIDPLGLGITWRNTLHPLKLLSLVDRHVSLPSAFPASGYVKMVAEASLKFPGSRILRKFELDDFFIEINIDLKTQEDAITTILELQSTGSHERNGDRTDFLNFRIRTIYSGVSKLNALGCVRLRSLYGHKGSSLPRTARGSEATTLYSSDGSSSASDNDTSPTTSPLTTSFIHSDRDTELELQKPVSRGIDGHAEQYVQSSPQQKIVKTLPMSFGPSGFWFMTQFVGDPTFFNGTVSFLITANLDIQFLSRLVHEMAGRHEGLRTAFFADSSHQPR